MLRERNWLVVVIVAAALAVHVGCSGAARMPAAYSVAGLVTVDGEPLNEGAIAFEPADGRGGVYGGQIRDGRYDVKVAAGPKKVSIVGMKELGVIGPTGQPAPSQFLPAKYNTRTELAATVEPRTNDIPFVLTVEKP